MVIPCCIHQINSNLPSSHLAAWQRGSTLPHSTHIPLKFSGLLSVRLNAQGMLLSLPMADPSHPPPSLPLWFLFPLTQHLPLSLNCTPLHLCVCLCDDDIGEVWFWVESVPPCVQMVWYNQRVNGMWPDYSAMEPVLPLSSPLHSNCEEISTVTWCGRRRTGIIYLPVYKTASCDVCKRVILPQRWWHIFMPNMGLNDRNAMNLTLYRSAAVRVWSLKALQSIKAHQVPSLNKTCESVRVMPPDSSSNIWKQTLVIIPLFCFQILTCTQEVDLLVWNGKPMQKLLKPAAETLSISYSPIWSKIYHQCSRVLPPSYWHVATMATWDDGVCCKWVSYLL